MNSWTRTLSNYRDRMETVTYDRICMELIIDEEGYTIQITDFDVHGKNRILEEDFATRREAIDTWHELFGQDIENGVLPRHPKEFSFVKDCMKDW